MVKKLIKYDAIAFGRVVIPVYLIVIGVALLNRFVQLFENDNAAYNIIFVSSVILLVIGCIACVGLTVACTITRFYKNLFTREGYLSFTLPVTVNQHIISKLVVSVFYDFISLITVILAISAATCGEVFSELVKAVVYITKMAADSLGVATLIAYILEVLVTVITAFAASALVFYFCISLGQLAKKNRVLLALGVYFGLEFVLQTVGTVIITLLTTFSTELCLNQLIDYLTLHPKTFTHLMFIGVIILEVVLGGVFWLVSHKVLTKRLNLA